MIIHVTLYGLLRELLPHDARGRADFELPKGSSLADLASRLRLQGSPVFSVNGEVERSPDRLLKDGDQVNIFRAPGGGQVRLG